MRLARILSYNNNTQSIGTYDTACDYFPRVGEPPWPRKITFAPTEQVNISRRRAWPLTGSHHVSVVRPRSELHGTRLLVEREVLDVYLAKRLVDGRRFPHHFARVVQYGFGHYRHFVVAVGAAKHVRRCTLHSRLVSSRTHGVQWMRYVINVFRQNI